MQQTHVPGGRSPPHLGTLIGLTALATLSLNMFLPSLAAIAEQLGTSYATASLSISLYLAMTGLVQIIAGPLSDRLGRRPVMLGALALFTLASLGCALAGNIETFVAFRLAQAVVVSCFTLSLAVVRDTAPPAKAAGLIATVSMAMALAPMLGPLLGGTLDALLGWRANFYAYGAVGLVLFVLTWVDLGETRPARAGGGTVHRRAVSDLLRAARFWGYALCLCFSIGGFYAFLAGAPLVADRTFGLSSGGIGIAIGSISAGFVVGSFLSSRLAPRLPLTTMMLAGRISATLGAAAGLVGLHAVGPVPLLYFGATVFFGLGNGLTMPSANAGAVSVAPHLAGTAAGLAGALTVSMGALVTFLAGRLLTEGNAAAALLALMLALGVAGLITALWLRRQG